MTERAKTQRSTIFGHTEEEWAEIAESCIQGKGDAPSDTFEWMVKHSKTLGTEPSEEAKMFAKYLFESHAHRIYTVFS